MKEETNGNRMKLLAAISLLLFTAWMIGQGIESTADTVTAAMASMAGGYLLTSYLLGGRK